MDKKKVSIFALVSAGILGGYLVGQARADGIPETDPLFYAGTLTQDGAPFTELVSLTIQLFDASAGGNLVCGLEDLAVTPDATGRFRAALPADCVDGIGQNPDLFVQLEVNGSVLGERAKIGATPYAVEAARATEALRMTHTNPVTGGQYSVNATVCGETAPTTGALGGYAGAKSLCETTCNDSPTAHMCTSEEIMRFTATGGALFPDYRWVASGVFSESNADSTDCFGWSEDEAFRRGAAWTSANGTNVPDVRTCDVSFPVLCCD